MNAIEDAGQRFQNDVAEHVMAVKHEDGLYRHLRFGKPESSFYWFDLVTWPGNLVVVGDMGGYTFARVTDMFEFFRAASGWNHNTINPHYWAEKLRADSGVLEYSEARFRAIVTDLVNENEEEHPGLRDAVNLRIFDDYDVSFEEEARTAVSRFEHGKFRFEDVWEWRLQDYRYQYLWCCHAIQWGIGIYDASRAAVAVAA